MLEGTDHGPYLEHFGLFELQTFDRADQIGTAKHFFARIDDAGASSLVIRVPEMGLDSGSLLHEDRMAQATDPGDSEGAQSGPVFITMFLARDSNDHRTGLLGAGRSGMAWPQVHPGSTPVTR